MSCRFGFASSRSNPSTPEVGLRRTRPRGFSTQRVAVRRGGQACRAGRPQARAPLGQTVNDLGRPSQAPIFQPWVSLKLRFSILPRRADLADAQASVSWAFAQLSPLARRLDAWLDRSVVVELRDPGPQTTHNLIIGVEKELLPLFFNVEVGMYLNAIRSSLDILGDDPRAAPRFANRKEEQIYFPIAFRDEANFQDKKSYGRKLINMLARQRPRDHTETVEAV